MDININKYIEYTLLKPDAKADEIIDLCKDAIKYQFATVCINPTYIILAKEILDKKDVKICAMIGFPLGASTNIVKLMEAKDAIEKGADELDVVINIGALKDGKVQYVLNELQAIKKIAGTRNVKATIEIPLLSREEIITVSKIAVSAGMDYIKTSTEFFSSDDFSLDNISLIREISNNKLKIKVAGIETAKNAKNLLNMGIKRIGTSNAIEIYKALSSKKKYKKDMIIDNSKK